MFPVKYRGREANKCRKSPGKQLLHHKSCQALTQQRWSNNVVYSYLYIKREAGGGGYAPKHTRTYT